MGIGCVNVELGVRMQGHAGATVFQSCSVSHTLKLSALRGFA